MKGNAAWIALAACIVLLAGCPEPAGTASLFPTTTGSTWKYRTVTIDITDATSPDTLPGSTMAATITASGPVKLASNTEAVAMARHTEYFSHTEKARQANDTVMWVDDTFYVHATDRRIFQYTSTGPCRPDTLLVLPLSEGQQWNMIATTDASGREILITRLATGQEAVNVPAGTFEGAWRIEDSSSMAGVKFVSWYAPGTGHVRQLVEYERPDGRVMNDITELVSVKVR